MTSNNLSVNLVIVFFVAIYRLLNLSRGITVGHGGSTHVSTSGVNLQGAQMH